MKLSICFTIDSVPFTAGVISGQESLGGSESACLGLARALKAMGHDVHIFTTKLGADAPAFDQAGVPWHGMAKINAWATYAEWDVAIALRQPAYLEQVPAKFRVLWNQDLMPGQQMKDYVMSLAWRYDAVAYVSEYHRKQWETLVPELAPIGWATKNGHDAALAKKARESAVKKPNQIIHISRPERGLMPLLAMWPSVRAQRPDAELVLCRYSSMYDTGKGSWSEVCATFDEQVQLINAEVGGITYLGELGKPALYQAIAESAVMWYPGVSTFAETSCIAAVEAQACGTPLVASYKGALNETAPYATLVPGSAETDEAYHTASVAAVVKALDGCKNNTFLYRQEVQRGLKHVESYSYEAVAAEWEQWLLDSFQTRYETQKAAVMRQLDHFDDLVPAVLVAQELRAAGVSEGHPDFASVEAVEAIFRSVSEGDEHTADDYSAHALETIDEIEAHSARHETVVKQLDGCKRVLDVACGNGAMAIMLAQADPARTVVAVDFSAGNIARGNAAAEHYGVSNRVTFVCAPAWDMASQSPAWLGEQDEATFDGAVCGEFMEHVADATGLMLAIERLVKHMGRIVITVPKGPLTSLLPRQDVYHRSHVHAFSPADLDTMFGQKDAYIRLVLPWNNVSARGETVGQWIVSYRNDGPLGARPLERRMLTRPYARLSVGMIVNDTIDLRRCLDSVWALADEIVIGDCGANADDLALVLKEFPRKTRVIPVGTVMDLPEGFSEARNRVLAASVGEWFLWIDADEVLANPIAVGKYLENTVYRGCIITQNHLHLDAPMGTDIPCRLFRTGPDIQFYGCIHEQPQMGDCNGEIQPCLQISDAAIAHFGYLYEGIRKHKALTRNLPLLVRDREKFPTRELGHLLVLREHANMALWTLQQNGQSLTPIVQHHYGQVIAIFEDEFMDPRHKYHALGRPFYEAALRCVGGAMEVELAVAARVGGLDGNRARSERVWVRTADHLKSLMAFRLDRMLEPVTGAPLMDVEPLARDTREAVSA